MGYAGAMIHGSTGTVDSKRTALRRANAALFTRIEDLVEAVAAA